MMKVAVPKETASGELRVALIPATAKKLIDLGCEIAVERGLGVGAGYADAEYEAAGAKVVDSAKTAVADADIVLRLNKPTVAEVNMLKRGALHISYMDPLNDHQLVNAFAAAGVSGISMEFVPRTTLAQKMDALSSQANLAGYVSVLLASERLNKILPMMMTPAGTIPPARVFIIGAGVAGLQAIATAKRMGARVEAFDTRPVVEEQVASLGAKFVKIDLGETGQTEQGYAKELTPEQVEKQRAGMAKLCAGADIVITTAQVFGRKAPVIVTKEMVAGMKAGSIIVDGAVESGGNVEGSVLDKEVMTDNGVLIIGHGRLSNRVPNAASLMYSSNLFNMLEHFWDKKEKKLDMRLEDEIMAGCLIVHDGAVRNEMVKQSMGKGA